MAEFSELVGATASVSLHMQLNMNPREAESLEMALPAKESHLVTNGTTTETVGFRCARARRHRTVHRCPADHPTCAYMGGRKRVGL